MRRLGSLIAVGVVGVVVVGCGGRGAAPPVPGVSVPPVEAAPVEAAPSPSSQDCVAMTAAEVAAIAIATCDVFDRGAPLCRTVCPPTFDARWIGCRAVCPDPPDPDLPACAATVPCPSPPDRRVRACGPSHVPPCERATAGGRCANAARASVLGVLAAPGHADVAILLLDRGAFDGVTTAWTVELPPGPDQLVSRCTARLARVEAGASVAVVRLAPAALVRVHQVALWPPGV